MSTRSRRLAVALGSLAFLLEGATAGAGTDWLADTPTQKPPRLAAMASGWDPVSNRMIMFGGYDALQYRNDTWSFDGATWTKLVTPVAPGARAAARMAFDEPTQKLVLFGGFNGAYLGDTWTFDGATATWSQASPTTSPKAVTAPILFTDPANGHADVYGGYDGMFYQLKTYRWSGANWVQVLTPHSPPARSSAAVALDPVHHNVVLFGGLASVNPWNTWLFDGSDWHEQSPSVQPANRYDAQAAFDPELGATVLFGGGSGGDTLNDTWEWTGSDWQQLFPAHMPGPREAFAMAFDPALGRIVTACGQDHALLLNDTWSWSDLGEFVDIGPGIGGALGAPVLAGAGDLAAGSPEGFTIGLSNAPPSAPFVLFLSLSQGAAPLKGGTFYPLPVLLQLGLVADATGKLVLGSTIPAAVPSGTSFVLQDWMADATAPQHFGATNGLKAIVP